MDLSNCKLIESCDYRIRQGNSNSPESVMRHESKYKNKSGGISFEKSRILNSHSPWQQKKASKNSLKAIKNLHLEIKSRRYFIKKLTPLEIKTSYKPVKKVYDYLVGAENHYPLKNWFRPNSLTPLSLKSKKFLMKNEKFNPSSPVNLKKDNQRYEMLHAFSP